MQESVQEKAKAYDEAIEYAYYLISERCKEGTEGSFHRSDLQKMFPTLAEGEGERIRKELLNAFQEAEDSLYMVLTPHRRETFIAWLEKQGDKDKLIKELGEYKVKYTQEVLGKYMSNKDDERLRKTTIAFLKEFADKGYENAVECIDWLEKQGEQKPAWSEEDEETFSYLEDVVDFCYRNQFVVDVQTCERVRQLVSRLKSLCFQSKWSKDDITRIDEIIETLNIVQANRVRTQRMHYNKATIDKNIDWLKSLKERYTWKPSEEQMEVLAWCKPLFADPKSKGILESLINDLHELKGISYDSI